MVLHNLNLRIEYCDVVLNGIKTFEIRKNDRDFQVGDIIKFYPCEFDVNCNIFRACKHEIIDCCFIITYILSDFGLKDGYVVLAIVPDEPDMLF